MPSDWDDDEGMPEMRPGGRARRRGPSRGQIMRRRLVALGSIVVVVVAVIIVLTSSQGDDDAGQATAHTSQAKKAAQKTPKKAESGKVTNATPQADWAPHRGPVPILEYHDLGSPPEGEPYPELFVGRDDFAKQMDWLEERGYEAVTLEQVEEAWYHDGKLPPKPIVLSFDDGYRPQFTFALPTLKKHGWAGVLNLRAEGSDLYESNVKAMIAAGWELAAHTIHHLNLTELGPEEVEEEVAGSRKLLQHEYAVPVDNFCYPSGDFDESVVEAVEGAGYTGAMTEITGFAERGKPFELARLEILRGTHVGGLAAALKNEEAETTEGAG